MVVISVDSDMSGSRNMGSTTGTTGGYGSGTTGSGLGHTGNTDGYGSSTTGSGLGNTGTTATGKKPGLMDKLNPMKDSDGDGKKGVMN